jgi:hypothetical protein
MSNLALGKKCQKGFSFEESLDAIIAAIFSQGVIVGRHAKPLNFRDVVVAHLMYSKFQGINIEGGRFRIEFIPAASLHFALEALFSGRENHADRSSDGENEPGRRRDLWVGSNPASKGCGAAKDFSKGESCFASAKQALHAQAIARSISNVEYCFSVSTRRDCHLYVPLDQVGSAAALAEVVLAFCVQLFPWRAVLGVFSDFGKFHYSHLGGLAAHFMSCKRSGRAVLAAVFAGMAPVHLFASEVGA